MLRIRKVEPLGRGWRARGLDHRVRREQSSTAAAGPFNGTRATGW